MHDTAFLLGNLSTAHTVLSLLAVPGTVTTLPLHNMLPGGGWSVIGLIAVANGLIYGLVAYLVVRVRSRI